MNLIKVVCFGWGSMNLKIFFYITTCVWLKKARQFWNMAVLSVVCFCGVGWGFNKVFFFSFLLIKSSFKGWFVLFISTRGMFFSSYFLSGVKGSSFCIVLWRFWKYVLLLNFLPHGSAVHVIVCWYSNS